MEAEIKKPKIVVLCGPTAIGKTSAAINLALALGTEIISADSVQIYRYMDIGTAKPTENERNTVRHHMIDIVDPDEPFDAALFAQKANAIILHLVDLNKVPIVAGGTGFYIKALIQGLFQADPISPKTRIRLKKEAEDAGLDPMYKRLTAVDPVTAASIHPNDRYRILRALEVFEETGTPISQVRTHHGFSDHPFEVLKIGLAMDRKQLYDRINKRVDDMIEQGLVEEVKQLLESGYTGGLKSMQTIGYRHIIQFLDGKNSWDETVRILKRDTRRYAKRQLTWFGKDPDIHWVEPDDSHKLSQWVKDFLVPS